MGDHDDARHGSHPVPGVPVAPVPGVGRDADGTDHVVSVTLSSLGWCSAVLRVVPADGAGSATVTAHWSSAAPCRCSPALDTGLEALMRSAVTTGTTARSVTPAGPDGFVALAVPVPWGPMGGAVICFHGPATADCGTETENVLDTLAGLIARTVVADAALSGTRGRAAKAEQYRPDPTLAADVFAATIVMANGRWQWGYFGPNAHTIFGGEVGRDQAFPDLLESHVHVEDGQTARQLLRAAALGRDFEEQIRVTGLDGVVRSILWRGTRRDDSGAVMDLVATDVTARSNLSSTHRDLLLTHESYARRVDLVRHHDLVVRDANDQVLQRVFAAGLRLQILQRRLGEVDAHAVAAIAFQLDQAANDIREIIFGLNLKIMDSGLVAAVDKLSNRWEQTAGLSCTVDLQGDLASLDPLIATAATKAVEHGLAVAASRGGGNSDPVTVAIDDAGAMLTVRVQLPWAPALDDALAASLAAAQHSAHCLDGDAGWVRAGAGARFEWRVPRDGHSALGDERLVGVDHVA